MSDQRPNYELSERFERTLAKAVEIHRDHARKGSGVPYIGHLLSVAGLVLEDGGSEDEAIAALLHDAIEDRDYEGLEEELRTEFGEEVTEIVIGCSQEQVSGADPGWATRKRMYLDHLDTAPPSVLRVSLADKLSNLRSILRDHRSHGDELWERFTTRDPAPILGYYEDLAQRYTRRYPGAMAEEFAHEVARLRETVWE